MSDGYAVPSGKERLQIAKARHLAEARSILDEVATDRAFHESVLDWAVTQGWAVFHDADRARHVDGLPDLVLVRPPVVLFAELRRDKATAADVKQHQWLDRLHRCRDVRSFRWRPDDWNEIREVLR